MRRITKTDNCAAICTNIVVEDPAFVIVIRALVVWCLVILVERVSDAFFEDLLGILRLRRALWTWFCVR